MFMSITIKDSEKLKCHGGYLKKELVKDPHPQTGAGLWFKKDVKLVSSDGESGRKWPPSFTVGGAINWYDLSWVGWTVQQTKLCRVLLAFGTAFLFLGIYHKATIRIHSRISFRDVPCNINNQGEKSETT